VSARVEALARLARAWNLGFWKRDGTECEGVLEWAHLIEDQGYCYLAVTDIGAVRVSTVWLGIDPARRSPPHIFETWNQATDYRETYSSEGEALAGHEAEVARVRAQLAAVSAGGSP